MGISLGQVVSQRELLRSRGEWKRTGGEVVCAYGAFDLLHPGHIRLLEQARDFGKILVAAVTSDELVRAVAARTSSSNAVASDRNAERPITPATERAEILAALSAVDYAAVVDDPLIEFLRNFRPDIFVCGDQTDIQSANPHAIASEALGRALAAIGCQFVRLPLEPGYSTSRLIERISGGRA